MITIAAALIGAILGGMNAKRRGGNRLDILQYTFTFALAFGLVGFFVTIIIEKWVS